MMKWLHRLRWTLAIFAVCAISALLVVINYIHIEADRTAYSEHVSQALRFCDVHYYPGVLRETRVLEDIAHNPAEVAYALELRRKFRLGECELPLRPTLSVEEAGLP